MSNGNGQTSIDALTEQVGRLTEGLTELKVVLSDGLTEIKDSVARVASTVEEVSEMTRQQAAVAQTQSTSVDRLTKIVEGLLVERQ